MTRALRDRPLTRAVLAACVALCAFAPLLAASSARAQGEAAPQAAPPPKTPAVKQAPAQDAKRTPATEKAKATAAKQASDVSAKKAPPAKRAVPKHRKQAQPEPLPEAALLDAPSPKAPDPALEKGGSTACYRLRPQSIHGRCEPQSLPYARCRTGDMSCRGNHELSPIGWYRCADMLGKTRQTPSPGAVFILDDNFRHRMATGHVFVVEKVHDQGGGRFELTLSHTNHDRKCSIETHVLADYDQHAKNLSMKTGAWSRWGKRLKTLGFIVKQGG